MRLPSKRPVWIIWVICLALAGFAIYRSFDGYRHPVSAGNLARVVREMGFVPTNYDLPITPLVLLDFMPGRWPESGTMDEARVTEIEHLIGARSAAASQSKIGDLGFELQRFNEAAGLVGPKALCTVAPPGFDRMLADLEKQREALLAELGINDAKSAMEIAAQNFDKRLDAKPREECAELVAFIAVGYSGASGADIDKRLKLRLRAAAQSGSAADWAAVRELDDRILAVFRVLIELSQAVAKSNDVGQEARRLVDARLEQTDTVLKENPRQGRSLLLLELVLYLWVAIRAASWWQNGIESALAKRRKARAMDKAVLTPSTQPSA
jgi:hypothetical protein